MFLHGRMPICILILLTALGFAHHSAHAQAVKATILGVVTDSSGAAIPGAKVSVTNSGTGITRTTTSDSQGRYTVPDLDIGTYEVDAEAAGFQASRPHRH